MNIEQFLTRYGRDSQGSRRFLRRLLASRLAIDEASVFTWPERELPASVAAGLIRDAAAYQAGAPEAYLLGFVPFLDWDFLCDKRALIPRPETEALVQLAIERLRAGPAPREILDLCCGGGVIGLSLALAFPAAMVTLSDISGEALGLCGDNIVKHGLQARTRRVQGDLWSPFTAEDRFDLVIANPPYVAAEDEVENSVLRHEHAGALFSDDRGTGHVKRILLELPNRLNRPGLAFFELSHRHEEILAPWLASRFDRETYYWERDPFGVPRYFIYDDARPGPTKH